VMHNYFGTSTVVKGILNIALTEPKRNIDFIRQDIINKNASPKPVAITEYNIGSGSVDRATSYVNGMQATVLICEMIKNNFGLGARWLLITGEGGMFYDGSNTNYLYHPHPDFYYLHFLPKFYGDHAISTASTDRDILSYASVYSSGEIGVIIVNKGDAEQVISVDMKSIGVGQNYYIYSFIGGTDNGDFSQNVYINGYGPSANHWGPIDGLSDLPADSYPIENEIKIVSPGRSVQMVMIEGGNNYVSVEDKANSELAHSFALYQNYPNPFNPSTLISYQLPSSDFVTLKVYDVLGKEVKMLVNERQHAGNHSVQFDASSLPNGVYFYKIEAGTYCDTRKLLLLK
ncbi:MAG: T9SS type A sorting domain-containing protein, partial [Calditrichaceae bacterium]|nr:T9SS type A sorting domain-containing protein [Calditrichaceae bacterium]